MRAAVISEYRVPPALGEREEPQAAEGNAVLELRAAGLNPADLAVASGSFPFGSPPLPYVPGIEGVGTVVRSGRFPPGTRVWASGRGLGVGTDGSFSERFAASDDVLVEVPGSADDLVAAALGVVGLAAWMPLAWLARVRPGESVLVLGATGAVGSVAVQAAKILGAGRVVGAGRDAARLERASELGADAVVELEAEGLAERLAAAFAGAPPTVVFDTLWGPPLEAAAVAAGPGARIVHLGQSAGLNATLPSGVVRGKQLQILGYSNFAVPHEEIADGYRDLLGHAAAGRIRVDAEAIPLGTVAEAWARQARGAGTKLVIVP
jgi:NADPH:quinone reductase-like Zn-dependent oxidoreductase